MAFPQLISFCHIDMLINMSSLEIKVDNIVVSHFDGLFNKLEGFFAFVLPLPCVSNNFKNLFWWSFQVDLTQQLIHKIQADFSIFSKTLSCVFEVAIASLINLTNFLSLLFTSLEIFINFSIEEDGESKKLGVFLFFFIYLEIDR